MPTRIIGRISDELPSPEEDLLALHDFLSLSEQTMYRLNQFMPMVILEPDDKSKLSRCFDRLLKKFKDATSRCHQGSRSRGFCDEEEYVTSLLIVSEPLLNTLGQLQEEWMQALSRGIFDDAARSVQWWEMRSERLFLMLWARRLPSGPSPDTADHTDIIDSGAAEPGKPFVHPSRQALIDSYRQENPQPWRRWRRLIIDDVRDVDDGNVQPGQDGQPGHDG